MVFDDSLSHTVAQLVRARESSNIDDSLVRALLANSKVPGSSPSVVTDDFFFLSYVAQLQVLSFGEKRGYAFQRPKRVGKLVSL